MDSDWRTRAACIGMNPELFFVTTSSIDARKAVMAACASCPVRQECLQFALRHREEFGIWGGLDTSARLLARRELDLPKPPPAYPLQPHGSAAARKRHERAGEAPCAECRIGDTARAAARAAKRKRQQRKQEAA